MDNKKLKEVEPSEFDLFIRDTALKSKPSLAKSDFEGIKKEFMNHTKQVFKAYEELTDLKTVIETNPKVVRFIELLISGEKPTEAIEKADMGGTLRKVTEENRVAENEVKREKSLTKEKTSEIYKFYDEKERLGYEIEPFVIYAKEFIEKFYATDISADLLNVLWRAYVHEEECGKSYKTGLIDGKNSKIEQLRSERQNSDGLDSVSGGTAGKDTKVKMGYIEKLLNNM